MKLFKKITRKNLLWLLFLMIFLLSVSLTAAHNKVAVIPLFGDQSGAPSAIAKTGQTTSYATGDDGDLQMGVSWPAPRFIDNGDGSVTDKLTGLIWLKNASCPNEIKKWSDALTFAKSLYDGWTGDGSGGDCGLSDGSSAGAWRLPNVRELHSLIDFGRSGPALPALHPFTGVQSNNYWSSTTNDYDPDTAWAVYMYSGHVVDYYMVDNSFYVWPVRGGN